MKFLFNKSSNKNYRYIYNAEHPQHDEIMSEIPAATAEKLTAAVESHDEMTAMLADALILKVGNSLGEPQDSDLNAVAAEMLRSQGVAVTPQAGIALAAELKAILLAHQAGEPVVVPAIDTTLSESAENIYPESPYLNVGARNHIAETLASTSANRARLVEEFEDNLSYTFEEVDTAHHETLKIAVNQMVTDLIDVRFDQNHNGTDLIDWTNFRDKYETQLSLFIDDPANITTYLEANPVLPESVGSDITTEQLEAKYGPSGVQALVMSALPAEESLAVLRLGYTQNMSPERMQEMAQLVGMMNATIAKFEQQIKTFPQLNSPYNRISITELTDIKDRVLRGFNILESPADLSDVNQRIQSMSQIVEAYVDKDLSGIESAEQQAQHKRLSDFIDSYEAQLGNRNPEALSAVRQALLTGKINVAITATRELVSSGLNANVVDLVSSFQISSAQMPDGTLITADMIANDDTALFQSIRYMNDFAAAGEVAQESIVNADAVVGAHVLNYVADNESRFNAQAETSVQGYLDQLVSSDPVGYQVMLQQIDANGGRQNLVANFAKEMAAIEGFKDYVDNNHGVAGNAEILELYANMEGYGMFVFSDANVDAMGGLLAGIMLTGPAFYQSIARVGTRGLTRVGATLPTRQALVAQSRAFLKSEASGFGRAMADDVASSTDDIARGLAKIPGLSSPAIQTIRQQAQRLGRAALNTVDDLAERAAARSALLRQVQTLPPQQVVGVTTALAATGYLVSSDLSDITIGSPTQAGTSDPEINITTPRPLGLPNLNLADLSNIDTTSVAPVDAEVKPVLTVTEQIAELTPEGFANLGSAISNIFKKYENYTSGQWREITDKVAALDGITLSTDAEREAYGKKLQAYIRTKLNISDEEADDNLTDGAAGPDTMSSWRLAQMSFTPDEFAAQTEDLQKFTSLGTWKENNIAIAQTMGRDLSEASTEELITFGKSYQAFAYGRSAIDHRNDGKIGPGTLSADDDKFAPDTS